MLYKHIHHTSWFSKHNSKALYKQSEYALCRRGMRKEKQRQIQEQKVICSKVVSSTFDEKFLEFQTLKSLARILMIRINDYIPFP